MKSTLIFEWPERHHLHLMLPVTVLFAAALHVGLFFVFTIIYPHPENSALDPAQIYFIPPGNEAAGRLQGLLRYADPAVFAPGRGLDLPEPVPPVAYVPSYTSDKPVLDPLPRPGKAGLQQVPVSGPVPVPRAIPGVPATPIPTPTRLVSTDEALAARLPELPEGVVFLVPQGFDPEPLVFLVSVEGDGRMVHLFLQHSSGNSSLDAKASALLRGLKFAPGTPDGSWGFVTFQWGSDLRPVVPQ